MAEKQKPDGGTRACMSVLSDSRTFMWEEVGKLSRRLHGHRDGPGVLRGQRPATPPLPPSLSSSRSPLSWNPIHINTHPEGPHPMDAPPRSLLYCCPLSVPSTQLASWPCWLPTQSPEVTELPGLALKPDAWKGQCLQVWGAAVSTQAPESPLGKALGSLSVLPGQPQEVLTPEASRPAR